MAAGSTFRQDLKVVSSLSAKAASQVIDAAASVDANAAQTSVSTTNCSIKIGRNTATT